MLVAVLRSIILYVIIIFAIRLMGKRQIGEIQPSELVITILVSNIATLPIEDTSLPMLTGILPIMTLVCLDVVMSGITMKSRFIRRIVSGTPKIIIQNGIIEQKTLKALRFTVDDIMEALHELGIFDIKEVQFAVVETTGKISVYQKYEYQNTTNGDLNIKNSSENPPAVVINDGILVEKALSTVKKGRGWVEKLLSSENVKIKDVFLLSVSENSEYTLIKKENSN